MLVSDGFETTEESVRVRVANSVPEVQYLVNATAEHGSVRLKSRVCHTSSFHYRWSSIATDGQSSVILSVSSAIVSVFFCCRDMSLRICIVSFFYPYILQVHVHV